MASRRVNPCRIKQHFSYTAGELADCLGVHKNTVLNWHREGLVAVDAGRPLLLHGTAAREFLAKRIANRKQPCVPDTMYCLRCRHPSRPAGLVIIITHIKAGSGNVRGHCEVCGTAMHRRVRERDLAVVMPNCAIQQPHEEASLRGTSIPSLNCDLERLG